MDDIIKKQLHENSFRFKRSLDRIIDKYSKVQYLDAGIEVALDEISPTTLGSYMKLSKKKLNSLEAKSFTDLREESLKTQDTTGGSQLVSSSDISIQHSVEDNGMTRNDITQLSVSSLDESQRNLSNIEFQPKDQDEELEMSLRSHGSSLAELYPNMIRRIGEAWQRQHVSTAADSVLRQYRRWRHQSNGSNLNNTFVTLRHTNSKPKKMSFKDVPKKSSSSPMKGHFMRAEAAPLQTVTVEQNSQEPHRSPGKEKNFTRKQQHKPVIVMDFSASCESFKPREISLNKTFMVSQLSPPKQTQLEEQASVYMVSHSRPCAKSPNKRVSLSALDMAGSSTFTPQFTAAIQRPDIYGSPVRQSLLKARAVASLGRSPHSFSRSSSEDSVSSREPMRPRSLTNSLSSPTKRPVVPLYPQNAQQIPQMRSPHSGTAAGGHRRFVRHLSFDSDLPSTSVSYSPKQVDEEFMKLYHRFVCQNKSTSFNGPPCRLCARNSEASRGHSSLSLAALALSPHRSVLRKRHRQLDGNSHPQSKRTREAYCTYSPGSKRHREMLRQGISPSELEMPHGGGPSYSSIKHGRFQKFRSQQPAEHEEDVLEDFSDMGNYEEFRKEDS
ncbi:uncharacterized protein LOC115779113 isoform X2 [Archocentrus centrarchus]|uniref:uncharacterized protein LOC115779113 isoform X2 n=1 Tax=Archocentrus centrarchus TaxID=63155 RepID=UPI0011E9B943|nr:uncharacterized protein LOC115779113 isoform X2 [Archocentrus centrarchus]